MAKTEAAEEVAGRAHAAPAAQVLIGVPAPVDLAHLDEALAGLGQAQAASNGGNVVVAYPSVSGASSGNGGYPGVRLLPYDFPGGVSGPIPWLPQAAAYDALFRLTREVGASACVVLHPDLKGLNASAIDDLSTPLLSNTCDLVMPVYPVNRLEGLLNFGVLEPLSRALYGRWVRFPLAPEFAVSGGFADLLLQRSAARRETGGTALLWPAAEAAVRDRRMWEMHLPVHHELSAEGVDLSAILTHVVGALFAEMERNAAVWQRVRGSQPVTVSGAPAMPGPEDIHTQGNAKQIDPRPMVEAFQLGYRNLQQEVWSLVLPPVTLLQLKAISRQPAESFRMPDELWAKMLYDFALAHRLRTIGRNHLIGALTPLYLGWVASYVGEVSAMSEDEAETRRERLQRAFEETKPYLLQRWRWPDRFNP